MAISSQRADKAAKYNIRNAPTIGWNKYYPQIAAALGLGGTYPSPERFAHAVAAWQSDNRPLFADGMLGPKTWEVMKPATKKRSADLGGPIPRWLPGGRQSRSPIAMADGIGPGPDWFRVAEYERLRWRLETIGWDEQRLSNQEEHLDWDEQYFYCAPYWGDQQREPGDQPPRNSDWCAAFVNYCLHRAGYSHTGSAGARSFLFPGQWHFDALEEPRVGCIIVVQRAGYHIGFLASTRGLPSNPGGNVRPDPHFQLLGGNQGGRISVKNEDRTLRAARGQNGTTSPYLWPKIGPANCNMIVPTQWPHHCHRRHHD